MAIATINLLEQAMKDIYLDPLIKMIDENSGPILAALEKKNRKLEGDKFVFAVQYGRNGGIGARGEADDLPESNPRYVRKGMGTQRNLYARIAFSEKFLKQVESDKAAFIEGVTAQMDDLTVDAKDYMRRNVITSHTGIMAKVKGTVTTQAKVTLEDDTVMNQFYAGQVIDAFTVDNIDNPKTQTKSVDGVRIKDVDKVAKTITLEKTVTIPASSYISIHNTFLNELTGLMEIMKPDNEIYGINRAENKWFNPLVYEKSGSGGVAAFDSMLLQEAVDEVFDTTGTKPNIIAMNNATRRLYIAEQNAYKRNIEYKDIDGGTRLVSFDGIAISPEKYMKNGEVFVLNTDDFELGQLADWGWMDQDGSILRAVHNKAAYEATLTKYCELLCKRPAGQALIRFKK